MKTIYLKTGEEALVDDEDFDRVSAFKWRKKPGRNEVIYARATKWDRETKRYQHFSMHRLVLNPPGGVIIDHLNHNGLDNRKANLRLSTHSENVANSRKRNGAGSKFKGVSWDKNRECWQASVTKNGKAFFLGRFKSEEEAARAYNSRASELFGRFTCPNEVRP